MLHQLIQEILVVVEVVEVNKIPTQLMVVLGMLEVIHQQKETMVEGVTVKVVVQMLQVEVVEEGLVFKAKMLL